MTSKKTDPGFDVGEAWHYYLTIGSVPDYLPSHWYHGKRFRPWIHRLPSDPRCRTCYIPFEGLGGSIGRLGLGIMPSKMNPGMCNIYGTFARDEEGVALDQEVVANKENELVAVPKLLARLVLYKKVVCGDDMFTQRNLSVQIMAQSGDYLWYVKDNQARLHEDVQLFFETPDERAGWCRPKLPNTCAIPSKKGMVELKHAH